MSSYWAELEIASSTGTATSAVASKAERATAGCPYIDPWVPETRTADYAVIFMLVNRGH